ncbi:MAG: prepilin peptidase [Clostridiales bacterium]|nr:prepilin peptidase [Clostridiales bacterium]
MTRIDQSILLAFLFVFAWVDNRRKEMPLFLLGICGATGILLSRLSAGRSWRDILGGVCVGCLLLVFSLVIKESIGLADGLLLSAVGTYLGLWQNLQLLCAATMVCGVMGGILLLAKKCTRKEKLAFAPFVLVSYVMMLAPVP